MNTTDKRAVLEHLHTEIAAIKGPTDADRLAAWSKQHSETFPEDRPLTDVDVRQPDADDTGHLGMIEVATFCEGEYIESVYIDKERATELRDQLTTLLSWAGPPECPGHEWNMSEGEADENNLSGEGEQVIRCIHCGANGDV